MIGLTAQIGAFLLALAAPDAGAESGRDDLMHHAGAVSLAPDTGGVGTTGYYQARVEGRVTIRITPRRRDGRSLTALPAAPMTRMRAVPIDRCLPIADLAGVQVARNNALLLFLRDRSVVMASLERACRARDFYSGFYVAPTDDGQLCVDRDMLYSRTGAKCRVAGWQGLELVRD